MSETKDTYPKRIVGSVPDWHLSGVNVFTTRLFRLLRDRGWDATIVITNPTASESERAPLPADLNVVRFPQTPNRAIRERQAMLREELERRSPCIYLPNYDFDTAGVLPTLSSGVMTAGVLHSDEPVYYDFLRDLGDWMDGVIAVSRTIEDEVVARFPSVRPRLSRVACGVAIRASAPAKAATPPLRVAFAGRLSNYQKRISDVGDLIAKLHESGAPVEFDIAGDGSDRGELERRAAASIASGWTRVHGALSPEETAKLVDAAHVLILMSEFEGLPVVMLEAMEAGCVPVVTSIRSGIGDLVDDGRNGVMFPVGDIDAAAVALQRLATGDLPLAPMGAAARATLRGSEFTIEHAARCYEEQFARMCAARASGEFAPRPGRAFIPRHHRWGPRIAARWARITGRST